MIARCEIRIDDVGNFQYAAQIESSTKGPSSISMLDEYKRKDKLVWHEM